MKRAIRATAAILLALTTGIVIMASVPGVELPDWPWNLVAVSASTLAFALLLPEAIKDKEEKNG